MFGSSPNRVEADVGAWLLHCHRRVSNAFWRRMPLHSSGARRGEQAQRRCLRNEMAFRRKAGFNVKPNSGRISTTQSEARRDESSNAENEPSASNRSSRLAWPRSWGISGAWTNGKSRACVYERDLLLSSWLKRELPPRDYLLGSVMCTTSRWLVWGRPELEKLSSLSISPLLLPQGVSIPGLGSAGRPARVLYFDGELPAETFKERLQFIASRYGEDLNLYGYNRDALPDGEMPPFNTPDGEAWLWRKKGQNYKCSFSSLLFKTI